MIVAEHATIWIDTVFTTRSTLHESDLFDHYHPSYCLSSHRMKLQRESDFEKALLFAVALLTLVSFANGHTSSNAPDPIRTRKSSGERLGQYWGWGPPGRPLVCCWLFVIQWFIPSVETAARARFWKTYYYLVVRGRCWYLSPTAIPRRMHPTGWWNGWFFVNCINDIGLSTRQTWKRHTQATTPLFAFVFKIILEWTNSWFLFYSFGRICKIKVAIWFYREQISHSTKYSI